MKHRVISKNSKRDKFALCNKAGWRKYQAERISKMKKMKKEETK